MSTEKTFAPQQVTDILRRMEPTVAPRQPDDWMYWLLAGAELAGDKRVPAILSELNSANPAIGLLLNMRTGNWEWVRRYLSQAGIELQSYSVILSVLNHVRDKRVTAAVDKALAKAQASLRLAGSAAESLAILDQATQQLRAISTGLCEPSPDSTESG